ncbi:MAG: hypothetical protein HOP20_10710 [Sulfuriferula sp.]|nr:hypothetical protein [Sulfuriferula sp.]
MKIKQLTLALIALSAFTGAQANCIVYTDTDYTGKSMDLANGTEMPTLSLGFDNKISSVVLTGGSVLHAWDRTGYQGEELLFADNIERIAPQVGNDKISSLKCVGSKPALRTPLDPSPRPIGGAPLPYGPDTCKQGYVWREAYPNDHVCVTPVSREQAKADNAQRQARMASPHAKSDNDSCVMGYVWREAIPSDHVCVTGDIRERTKQENAEAASHKVRP